MKSILSILALSAAIAGPAAAQEVRVSLAGKDPATVEADIRKAAETVCYAGQKSGELRPQQMPQCVADTASDGMSQARAYQKASQPTAAAGDLASNSLAEAAASK